MSAPLADQLRTQIDKAAQAHKRVVEAAHQAAQDAVDARDTQQSATQETTQASGRG